MKVLLENENLDSEKIVNSTRIMIKPSLPKYVFHKPRWKLGELNFNSLLNDLDDMGGCTIPEFFCGLAYSKLCCEISSAWKADISMNNDGADFADYWSSYCSIPNFLNILKN